MLHGATYVFFAYIGFEAPTTAVQESRKTQKSIAIAIIGSIVICAALYVGVSTVMVGVVPYWKLDTDSPLAVTV